MKKLSGLIIAVLVLVFPPLKSTGNRFGIRHVLLVGFDGWGASSVMNADMPALKQLMKNGSYSLSVRSVLPSSSAVNWASLLMASPPELHGYTQWGSRKPELKPRVIGPGGIFPTILGQLKIQQPSIKTAVVYNWDGIGYLFEKNLTDSVIKASSDMEVIEKTVRMIRDLKPGFLFSYYSEPDGAGHTIGFNTPEYYEQLKRNDSYLDKIVKALKDAGIEKETLIIVCSDHGGINKGHGGITMDEMEIPLVFFGKGVKRQPEMQQSIMIYDIGATIAWIFKLKFPQVWVGRPIKKAFK